MKNIYPITCTAAAKLLGCRPSTVTRNALKHGIGHVAGPVRLLSAADVEQLRGLIQKKPGNPNFVTGNHFGQPAKKVARKKKKR